MSTKTAGGKNSSDSRVRVQGYIVREDKLVTSEDDAFSEDDDAFDFDPTSVEKVTTRKTKVFVQQIDEDGRLLSMCYIHGKFPYIGQWWHISVDVKICYGAMYSIGLPSYRLRSDLSARSQIFNRLVSVALKSENISSVAQSAESKAFLSFLNRQQITDFAPLYSRKVLKEMVVKCAKEQPSKSLHDSILMLKEYLNDSDELTEINWALDYPVSMSKLPLLQPRSAPAIIKHGVKSPAFLTAVEDMIVHRPYELAFHSTIKPRTGGSFAEVKISCFETAGLWNGMEQPYRDAVKVYHVLKEHCFSTGDTYITTHRLNGRSPRYKGYYLSYYHKAIEYLKVNQSVIEEDGRIYLRKLHDCELNIANTIHTMINKPSSFSYEPDFSSQDLSVLVGDPDQKTAVEMISGRPVVVMCGRGGCGKTEVVSRVCRVALHALYKAKMVEYHSYIKRHAVRELKRRQKLVPTEPSGESAGLCRDLSSDCRDHVSHCGSPCSSRSIIAESPDLSCSVDTATITATSVATVTATSVATTTATSVATTTATFVATTTATSVATTTATSVATVTGTDVTTTATSVATTTATSVATVTGTDATITETDAAIDETTACFGDVDDSLSDLFDDSSEGSFSQGEFTSVRCTADGPSKDVGDDVTVNGPSTDVGDDVTADGPSTDVGDDTTNWCLTICAASSSPSVDEKGGGECSLLSESATGPNMSSETNSEEDSDSEDCNHPPIPDPTHKSYILLTAPTGKAAKVLGKRSGFTGFTLHQIMFRYMTWLKQLKKMPFPFRDVHILVVDECSLVAVSNLSFVLYILRTHAKLERIIFLGDLQQLPSIEPGNFLTDIYAALSCRGCAITLRTNHRSEGRLIVENAVRIAGRFLPFFDTRKNFTMMSLKDSEHLELERDEAVKTLVKSDSFKSDRISQFVAFRRIDCEAINNICSKLYASNLCIDPSTKRPMFYENFKICCTRNGTVHVIILHDPSSEAKDLIVEKASQSLVASTSQGLVEVDSELETEQQRVERRTQEIKIRVAKYIEMAERQSEQGKLSEENPNPDNLSELGEMSNSKDTPGSKERVSRSCDLRLCNGEIFYIKAIFMEKTPKFERERWVIEGEDGLTLSVLKRSLMKECRMKPSWCRTIHTYQGSEIKHLAYVVGAAGRQNWQHVYTAVTRGKSSVTIIGEDENLRKAINTSQQNRFSCLEEKLKEMLDVPVQKANPDIESRLRNVSNNLTRGCSALSQTHPSHTSEQEFDELLRIEEDLVWGNSSIQDTCDVPVVSGPYVQTTSSTASKRRKLTTCTRPAEEIFDDLDEFQQTYNKLLPAAGLSTAHSDVDLDFSSEDEEEFLATATQPNIAAADRPSHIDTAAAHRPSHIDPATSCTSLLGSGGGNIKVVHCQVASERVDNGFVVLVPVTACSNSQSNAPPP